jgi:hypothetical protein
MEIGNPSASIMVPQLGHTILSMFNGTILSSSKIL